MFKKIIRKIIYGNKADSKSYVYYLMSKGVRIGNRTKFFAPRTGLVDTTRPWLLSIGDDVQIAQGVTILTHGYDWSVIKGLYGEILGSSGKVSIGNNVFIGVNTTILKGVSIGNNVIIGACSLVNKDVPNNCVVAGNPARIIMSLDEYYEKRKSAQIKEAHELVKEYIEVFGKLPNEESLSEFFWLFSDSNDPMPVCWHEKMKLLGNEQLSMEKFKEHKKAFKDLDDFINHGTGN